MKTVVKWVHRIVMFPIDTVCVLVAVLLIVCWVVLFRIPLTADRNGVDKFDLLLRTCQDNTAYPGHPLRDLLPRAPLAEGLADPDLPPGQMPKKLDSVRVGPFEYRQTFTLPDGSTITTTGTDRNVDVPVDELKRAKEAVAGLFDLSNPEEHAGVVTFGMELLRDAADLHPGGGVMTWTPIDDPTREWDSYRRPKGVSAKWDRPDFAAQEYWMAYRALHGHQPNAAADLGRLKEMGEQAFPDPKDRAAALAWAGQLYDHMVQIFDGHWARARRQSGGSDPMASGQSKYVTHKSFFTLPPKCKGTHWWLLYQFVGLDEPSRRAATAYVQHFFLPERMAAVEAMGNERLAARKAAGEPVPPDTPAAPFVALIEYYRGWDRDGAKSWAVVHAQDQAGKHNILEETGVILAYPSDDVTFILIGDDPLHVADNRDARFGVLFLCALLLVANRGLKVLFRLLGDWVLWLRHNKAYQHYRDGRGDPPAWVQWPVLAVVIVISWLVAWSRLEWPLLPVAPSPEWMLLGSAIATILGGKLIAAIGRVIALLMLRCGIDVEKVWYDEILGILLGVVVLHVFGNDWANICVYVLAEVLPAVAGHFYGRWKRRRERAKSGEDHPEQADGEQAAQDPAPKKGKLLASRPRVARPVPSPPVAKPAPPPPVAKPVVRRAKPVDE